MLLEHITNIVLLKFIRVRGKSVPIFWTGKGFVLDQARAKVFENVYEAIAAKPKGQEGIWIEYESFGFANKQNRR